MLKNTLHNFALSLSECYVLLAIVLSRPRSVYAHLGNAYLYMGLWLLIGVAYSLICCTQRLVPRHCKFTCSRACIVNNCQ